MPACLGTGRKRTGVGQQTECALREIVCPGDVADVDSHWFANREPQAPGAMCKQERLPLCRGWGSHRTGRAITRRQDCERPRCDGAQAAASLHRIQLFFQPGRQVELGMALPPHLSLGFGSLLIRLHGPHELNRSNRSTFPNSRLSPLQCPIRATRFPRGSGRRFSDCTGTTLAPEQEADNRSGPPSTEQQTEVVKCIYTPITFTSQRAHGARVRGEESRQTASPSTSTRNY